MILEAVRMVADALDHGIIGVNEQLKTLDRDAEDPIPPLIQRVRDTTRDDIAARGDVGSDFPALIVSVSTPSDGEGEVGTIFRDFRGVEVVILLVTNKKDSAEATRDTLYTLRAVIKTLRDLSDNLYNETLRKRNLVHLRVATRMEFGEVGLELGEGVLAGAVIVEYDVRDLAP